MFDVMIFRASPVFIVSGAWMTVTYFMPMYPMVSTQTLKCEPHGGVTGNMSLGNIVITGIITACQSG